MNLKHLKVFLCVAEQAHVTRAARLLHLPQAAVDHQLGVLEHQVGVALLRRAGDGAVELTEAGRILLDDVQLLVALGDSAVGRARRAMLPALPPPTLVRLGAVPVAMMDTVPLALEAVAERRLDVPVQVVETSSARQELALRDGSLDIALLHPPLRGGPGLSLRVIRAVPMSAVLWADHPLAARLRLSAEDLSTQRLLVPSAHGAPVLHAQIQRLRAAAPTPPEVLVFDGTLDAVVARVRGRDGVAFLPDTLRHAAYPGVVHRPLVGQPLSLELAVAWRPQDARSEVLALVALLVALADQRQRLSRWLERA